MEKIQVLFDHQTFEIQKYGGISRYFYEIIKNMKGVDAKVALLFSCNQYIKNKDITKYCSAIPFPVFKSLKGLFRIFNKRKSLKAIEASTCLFHPTYYNPYFLEAIGDRPFVLTVHDMIHEKFPQYFSTKDNTAVHKRLLIEKASRIIAISQRTKQDLIDLLHVDPERIDVVYHGIQSVKSTYHGLHLPENYILYVGERRGYKNFARLLEAFSILRKENKRLHLVCTGKPFRKEELAKFEAMGLSEVVRLVCADEEELGQLYRDACLFVYPSLYEGFGIPILEAYSNECPVVLSRSSCFPEVAGEAGVYFDPDSTDELVQAIGRVLDDRLRREELIRLGNERVKLYTWTETARQTEEVYRKVVTQQKRRN